MTITTLSSREFSQSIVRAKKAAENGPVFILNRGKHSHVLLSMESYRKLTKQRRNIADTLSMPECAEIEFEPQHVVIGLKQIDFS